MESTTNKHDSLAMGANKKPVYQIGMWKPENPNFPEDVSFEGQEVSAFEYEQLIEFLQIVRNCRGAATPVEEFLRLLVRQHCRQALTPDDILGEFEGDFTSNWSDTIETAAFIACQYPQLIREALPSGSVFRTSTETEKDRPASQRESDTHVEESLALVNLQQRIALLEMSAMASS
jgi:hypothetical protein